MEARLGSLRVPALGVVIVNQTETLGIAVAGQRSLDHSTLIKETDRWHLGSLTKSMTAVVAARMVARGEVRFDSTLAEVLEVPMLTTPCWIKCTFRYCTPPAPGQITAWVGSLVVNGDYGGLSCPMKAVILSGLPWPG